MSDDPILSQADDTVILSFEDTCNTLEKVATWLGLNKLSLNVDRVSENLDIKLSLKRFIRVEYE